MARCKSLFDNTLPATLSGSIFCKGQAMPLSPKSLKKRILAGSVKKIARMAIELTTMLSIF